MPTDAKKHENTLKFFEIVQQPYSEENTAFLINLIHEGIDIDAQYGQVLLSEECAKWIEDHVTDEGALQIFQERTKNPYRQNSPLHYAVINGYNKIVQELLKNGANVNIQNMDGDTPLHWAAIRLESQIIKMLLNNGANIDTPNHEEKTPLFVGLCNIEALPEVHRRFEIYKDFLYLIIKKISAEKCFDQLLEDFCITLLNEDLKDDWKKDNKKRQAIAKKEGIDTPRNMFNRIDDSIYHRNDLYTIIKILERQYANAMALKKTDISPLLGGLLANITYPNSCSSSSSSSSPVADDDLLAHSISPLLISKKPSGKRQQRDDSDLVAALDDDNDDELTDRKLKTARIN
ncbi:ankyrin repeat domain-containing protein [Candidatus Berkiella aquae]|uniref:Ankyrin repeat domain-containing protein n=1 Tax=Candidatus Berkiella aquae TaxID=295108 RepID=A0A0Q9YVD4_9GAMM|nr:ankyrin repeat domain-containing protein [Candidatus Berkiella aquae]MCS5711377.1 ankyrin repeat domain-containing protein [Candidatus Berkiella aquae]